MGKRRSLASITGGALAQEDTREDVVVKAVAEHTATNKPEPEDVKPKQRSREGMVSTSIWMSETARFELKMHAQHPGKGSGKETMEGFILRAVNKLLAEEGADFTIE